MTLSPTDPNLLAPTEPPSRALDRWAGITEDDATRIAAALAAAHAASTRKVYAFAWRRWVCWCATGAKDKRPARTAETRTGIEQDLALGQLPG